MSQATFEDDDLFGEAASEMRADVESSLADAKAALPSPDELWKAEADNTLGVLNTLKGALDVGDAEEHLRDAKKWFTMGQRADAFEDAEDLEAEIEAVEAILEDVTDAHEQVSELTSTIPQLRGALEEAQDDGNDGEGEGEETEASDEDSEAGETDAEASEADAEASDDE